MYIAAELLVDSLLMQVYMVFIPFYIQINAA